MASIAVVTSSPPGARGGHMVIADSLVTALRGAGHTPSLVTTPDCNFGYQVSSYVQTWRTDVAKAAGRRIDQVISLRFPSYAVRHERHVCWLNHTMREYYDLWPRFVQTLPRRSVVKERIKRSLARAVDRRLLGAVDRRMTISHTVERRLATYLGLRSEALWPPPPQRSYRCDGYGDYIFAFSRLTPLKRVDLIVRALATHEGRSVRLVVAGGGESRDELEALAAALGVADRVRFEGRIDDAQLVEHLARCRAVCFTPYDEDYGFVTVEAFAAAKPVITCLDSGGPTELVHAGENGFVVDPEPRAIAFALAQVMDDRAAAERLGAAGRRQADTMTWEDAIARLVIV